ncbi:hypothetical protein ACET3Z_009125 [Daucus carota]
MATSLPWRTSLPSKSQPLHLHHTRTHLFSTRHSTRLRAFRRNDFDDFSSSFSSGKLWTDLWKSANDGFEQFAYETRKTAEKIDRRFAVSRRLSDAAESARYRAKEIDRDLRIMDKWRSFSFDFSRNWPSYRKQLIEFFDTPLGKGITTIVFLWVALSGWLFRIVIFSIWVLPFAGPLLLGAFANFLVIKGSCPACKRQFIGAKTQTVRCAGCGNIVWQPQGDLFSRGSQGGSSSSKSEIIDVEFEEK